MPDRRRHRGPHPEDESLFGHRQVSVLQQATADLSWLLGRRYALPSSLKLVGDRYQLTARQRIAVSRSSCSNENRQKRLASQVSVPEISGHHICVDGYNVLTSIEVALSGGVLLRGVDGCLRDMASMHGSYRKVAETEPALRLLGEFLAEIEVSQCYWFFDEPVSNSGRLRSLMLSLARQYGWNWTVHLVPDPDAVLRETDQCIATADSEILNQCGCWINLVREIVTTHLPAAWIVEMAISTHPDRGQSPRSRFE
ncbi:MAG: DUF434 domain-containing protein [Planctomycetaceae bacterium]|nr:DUF434 domain-containing protein [Planctomycetaceae bacterium]